MPPTLSQTNLKGLSESQRVEELQLQLAEAELKRQLERQLADIDKQQVLREVQRLRDAIDAAAATAATTATAAATAATAAAAVTDTATVADSAGGKEQYAHQGALNAQRVPTAGSGTAKDPIEM